MVSYEQELPQNISKWKKLNCRHKSGIKEGFVESTPNIHVLRHVVFRHPVGEVNILKFNPPRGGCGCPLVWLSRILYLSRQPDNQMQLNNRKL
jgi:hypothetical protein